MRFFVGFCWVITFLCTCAAGVLLAGVAPRVLLSIQSEPAMAIVIAMALAVVPYVFTRAWEGIAGIENHKQVTELLSEIRDHLAGRTVR